METLEFVMTHIMPVLIAWSSSPSFLGDATLILIGLVALRLFFRLARIASRRARQRRRQRYARMFDAAQKKEGHGRAGGRCEFSSGLMRCRNKSYHGDHFYPYSRGGATTLKNFVASCEFHNLSKGAKMPSTFEKARIETRRRNYFPMLANTSVGEWA